MKKPLIILFSLLVLLNCEKKNGYVSLIIGQGQNPQTTPTAFVFTDSNTVYYLKKEYNKTHVSKAIVPKLNFQDINTFLESLTKIKINKGVKIEDAQYFEITSNLKSENKRDRIELDNLSSIDYDKLMDFISKIEKYEYHYISDTLNLELPLFHEKLPEPPPPMK